MKVLGKLMTAIGMLFIVQNIQADWIAISPEELEQQSDLIIIGEMIGETITQDVDVDQKIALGVIQVNEILKGDLKTDVALIKMPFIAPGILRSSIDVVFTKGQKGLWYLQADGNGYYFADRPDRFVATEFATDQIKTLRCDVEPPFHSDDK